jgi:hypothetical protein
MKCGFCNGATRVKLSSAASWLASAARVSIGAAITRLMG